MGIKINSRNKLRNSKIIILAIVALFIISFVGSLTFLKNIYQTETYYVIKEDLQNRTQITPEMMLPVVTSEGTAPQNALTVADIQGGAVFTKYPLRAGDILTASNVGAMEDISVGVPDSWVITSFAVGADDATGGRIRRGTYFDILAMSGTKSIYLFSNILCLDATVSMAGASNSQAADTDAAYKGQSQQYVVGMTHKDAALLHLARDAYKFKLVLSPRQNEYEKPDLDAAAGLFEFNNFRFNINQDWAPENLGKGTDATFTPVLRDSYGRPVTEKACAADKVAPKELCKKIEGKPTEKRGNSAITVKPKEEPGTNTEPSPENISPTPTPTVSPEPTPINPPKTDTGTASTPAG